jgi:hypothetical protein
MLVSERWSGSCAQRGFHGLRAAGDDDPAPLGEVGGDLAGDVTAVPGGGPGANHRYRPRRPRAGRRGPRPQRRQGRLGEHEKNGLGNLSATDVDQLTAMTSSAVAGRLGRVVMACPPGGGCVSWSASLDLTSHSACSLAGAAPGARLPRLKGQPEPAPRTARSDPRLSTSVAILGFA